MLPKLSISLGGYSKLLEATGRSDTAVVDIIGTIAYTKQREGGDVLHVYGLLLVIVDTLFLALPVVITARARAMRGWRGFSV